MVTQLKRAKDVVIGQGRITDQRADQYQVLVTAGRQLNKQHQLIREEIMVERRVGTEGTLVLRDNGFYIGYYLIPKESGLTAH